MLSKIIKIIPELKYEYKKGSSGKIGIIGGSIEYTGAPYYAGMAALKTGADICHIICSSEAAIPIKSYSPELIVHPYLPSNQNDINESIKKIDILINRLDSLVIGPGLGRNDSMLEIISNVIDKCIQNEIPVILDGDALYFLSKNITLLSNTNNLNHPIIITPNYTEYIRLCQAVGINNINENKINNEEMDVMLLSKKLHNIIIIKKGIRDIISNTTFQYINNENGSPRRCGGQGDVLAGCIGTFVAWNKRPSKENGDDLKIIRENYLVACMGASMLVKKSAFLAFNKYKRSMTTPDLISHIGSAFDLLFTEK